MPWLGPKILTVVELGKLLASEAGISEREATRILRAWGRILTRVIRSGYGVPLGRTMRIFAKPIAPRRYWNPIRREKDISKGKWKIEIMASRKTLYYMNEELGEPTKLDLKIFKKGNKGEHF